MLNKGEGGDIGRCNIMESFAGKSYNVLYIYIVFDSEWATNVVTSMG